MTQLITRIFPCGIKQELISLLKLAWPMVLTQMLQYLFGPMAVMFCGHLGKIELDCAALASSLINVTGLTVLLGISSACDTLFSQTFGSMENRHKLGMLLQRSTMILSLALIPCFAIHVNTEKLLLLVGQDPEIARLTGQYMLIAMPGLFFFSIYVSVSKYLQCQNIIMPVLLSTFLANLVHAGCSYIFLFVLDWRTNGSALAQVIGYFSMMAFLILYTKCSGVYKPTWRGLDKAAFLDWGQFLKLGGFGMLMIAIEWWSFEIGIFLAGTLGTVELGSQSLVFQIELFSYMFPLGVGISSSIRVGQFLGAGNADGAKTASRVSLCFSGLIGIGVAILLGSMRNILPHIFTNVSDVIEMSSGVLPILALYMFFDYCNGVGCGILRGMGLQKIGSALVAIVYSVALFAGAPTMLHTKLRIKGYWICLAVSVTLETVVLCFFLMTVNWPHHVEMALERISLTSDLSIFDSESKKQNEATDETPILEDNMETPKLDKATIRNRVLTLVALILILVIGVLIRVLTD